MEHILLYAHVVESTTHGKWDSNPLPVHLCIWTLTSRTVGLKGEPQGAKLALHGEVWKPSRALGQLVSSNVREEARAGSMERLTLRCTDTYLALSSQTMACKAVWKEMKGDNHRQTLGVVISGNGRAK